MNLLNVAFVIVILVTVIQSEEPEPNEEKSESGESTNLPLDSYTYVALIDIVFTDNCKRKCTGAIIHDTVVITAAHCFTNLNDKFSVPELSLSFVIIGTKLMFDSGYEQYLPIEKVVTHSKFEGWTADLALVFTFISMTVENPGEIIPLASRRVSTPVDSNVTVLSWGHCPEQENMDHEVTRNPEEPPKSRKKKRKKQYRAENDSNQSDRKENSYFRGTQGYKELTTDYYKDKLEKRLAESESLADGVLYRADTGINDFTPTEMTATLYPESNPKAIPPANNSGQPQQQIQSSPHRRRFLTQNKPINTQIEPYRHQQLLPEKLKSWRKGFGVELPNYHLRNHGKSNYYRHHERQSLKEDPFEKEDLYRQLEVYKSTTTREKEMGSHMNLRRNTEPVQNTLTTGSFGYINLGMCQKIIEKTLPPMYEIKNKNEVLCYSSDEFYIQKEDAGAPVVQHGYLVAVTVGGVESDGQHMAVGMKISCFCTWIKHFLPETGKPLKCCSNCCTSSDGRKVHRSVSNPVKKQLRSANNGFKLVDNFEETQKPNKENVVVNQTTEPFTTTRDYKESNESDYYFA